MKIFMLTDSMDIGGAETHVFELSRLLGLPISELYPHKSVDLMFAVAEMREVKSAEEIEKITEAQRITDLMMKDYSLAAFVSIS